MEGHSHSWPLVHVTFISIYISISLVLFFKWTKSNIQMHGKCGKHNGLPPSMLSHFNMRPYVNTIKSYCLNPLLSTESTIAYPQLSHASVGSFLTIRALASRGPPATPLHENFITILYSLRPRYELKVPLQIQRHAWRCLTRSDE